MKIKKCVFIILGCICLGLGTVGVFLPILPTTPFYLLTVFFFANSSQKLHDWFLGTKLYSSAGRVSSSERYGLHRADTGCGKLAFPEASGRGRENVRSGGNRRDGSQRRISKDPVGNVGTTRKIWQVVKTDILEIVEKSRSGEEPCDNLKFSEIHRRCQAYGRGKCGDRLHMHGLCILTDGITTRCCGLT